MNQVVDRIRIHAYEDHVAQFVFQLLHEWAVDHGLIHHHHFVAIGFAGFDLGMLCFGLSGVDEYHFVVFVGLGGFYLLNVFFDGVKFASQVFHQGVLDRFFVELIVAEHAVFHKNAQVAPLGFEVSAIFDEQFGQLVGYLFGNEAADAFDVAVGL